MKTATIDQFGFLLHDATRLLRKRFEARASEHGLSSAQWRAMVNLVKYGPMSQARLAEHLEIEPISVSRLIDRMEQGGWVERQADPTDRRAKVLVATGKSDKVFSSIRAVAGELFDEAMDGFSPDEKMALVSALATIVDNLSRTVADDIDPPLKSKQASR